MIQDLTLRWVITLLFAFSAGVCITAIVTNRHSVESRISHSLHAIMAIAMAVMAWPGGASLPSRPPMIFFAAAAVWFAVVVVRDTGHRAANIYHALMMLAMAWMYAAMGGLSLPMGVPWVMTLNWVCAVGFAAATAFWFYRFVVARVQNEKTVGVLCQLAMAAGMAVMFAVML